VIRVLALAMILFAPALSGAAVPNSASVTPIESASPRGGAPHPAAAPAEDAAPRVAVGEGAVAGSGGLEGDRPGLGGQGLDLSGPGGVSRSTDLDLGPWGGQARDVLPLSRFARGDVKPPPERQGFDIWGLLGRGKSGGLPEPAGWALMLVGFGMIGAALRGFVVANRRLARLQPEEPDEPGEP
jgi:hypothetical protein